jgi:hypothetical protein
MSWLESDERPPFTWTRGAVWLLPDGRSVIVPGFHDDWIRKHQDMVPGCANVCDVVLKNGWLSMVSYGEGYVEIMIPSRKDKNAVSLCSEQLRRNIELWRTALVMTMDEEGYIRLTPEDFLEEGAADTKIRGAFNLGRA